MKKCCKIEGCKGKGEIKKLGTEIFCKGFCVAHYNKFLKYGDPLIEKSKYGEERKKNPLYGTYNDIKKRCYNKNYKEYYLYGGRGIKMSDNWLGVNGFNNFCKDMGDKPSKNHSIDRYENDLGYSKENCKWANKREQAVNRRSTTIYGTGISLNKKTSKFEVRYYQDGRNYQSRKFTLPEAQIARQQFIFQAQLF